MEQEDKEKLRRAYSKACEMNLSPQVRKYLKKEVRRVHRSAAESANNVDVSKTAQDLDPKESLANSSSQMSAESAQLDQDIKSAKDSKNTLLVEKLEAIRRVRQSLQNASEQLPYPVQAIGDFPSPDESMLRKCMMDFSLAERKLVSAYLRLVPWVFYFTHREQGQLETLKTRYILLDPILRKFRRLAPNFPTELPPKVFMDPNFFSLDLGNEIPKFYPGMPVNAWCKVLAAISQILALNHVESVLECIHTWGTSLSGDSSAVVNFRKWIARNGKEAKMNWFQLHSAVQAFEGQNVQDLLVRFAIRLTASLCRNDHLALWSLANAPEPVLADFERWLIASCSI